MSYPDRICVICGAADIGRARQNKVFIGKEKQA